MKWLVGIWLSANVLVLAQAMLTHDTAYGAELSMLMYLLNLPSSILTGISLNTLGTINTASHFTNLLLIWVPFFTGGAMQWWCLRWLTRKASGS